ncbi:hypothetical protein HDK77DRAFT_223543 [Phyllosticta capitalensis]
MHHPSKSSNRSSKRSSTAIPALNVSFQQFCPWPPSPSPVPHVPPRASSILPILPTDPPLLLFSFAEFRSFFGPHTRMTGTHLRLTSRELPPGGAHRSRCCVGQERQSTWRAGYPARGHVVGAARIHTSTYMSASLCLLSLQSTVVVDDDLLGAIRSPHSSDVGPSGESFSLFTDTLGVSVVTNCQERGGCVDRRHPGDPASKN